MADTPAANLGYGKQTETTIDNANIAMRAMPWYQDYMRAHGQDPGHPTLTKSQSQEVLRLAQANGYVVDEGNMEVDDHGNFNPIGHKLRNTLIVAGLAAATIATMGAAGAFSGAASGASAAAGGAAPTAAGLGGVEAGAASGLGAAALPGAGTAIGAGSSLAGLAGVGAEGVAEGTSVAGLTGTALPELGGEAGTIAGSGLPAAGGALSTGDKLAKLAGGIGKLTNGISTAVTGQDPDLRGISAANAAAQAARNRILGAQVDQGGPGADKTALSNMRTAGLMANFKDTPASPYGNPAITIGDPTRNLASQFQTELMKRMNAGKSLTLSGVPDPTPQELADEQRARDIANGGSGIAGTPGKIVNGINTGARLASLVPGIVRGVRDIGSLF